MCVWGGEEGDASVREGRKKNGERRFRRSIQSTTSHHQILGFARAPERASSRTPPRARPRLRRGRCHRARDARARRESSTRARSDAAGPPIASAREKKRAQKKSERCRHAPPRLSPPNPPRSPPKPSPPPPAGRFLRCGGTYEDLPLRRGRTIEEERGQRRRRRGDARGKGAAFLAPSVVASSRRSSGRPIPRDSAGRRGDARRERNATPRILAKSDDAMMTHPAGAPPPPPPPDGGGGRSFASSAQEDMEATVDGWKDESCGGRAWPARWRAGVALAGRASRVRRVRSTELSR